MNIVAFVIWLTALLGYCPSESQIESELAKNDRPIEVVGADPTGG